MLLPVSSLSAAFNKIGFVSFIVFLTGIFFGGVCHGDSVPYAPEGIALSTSKEPVSIAKDGKAQIPITISPDSSDQLGKTAAQLATYLQRITGAVFVVERNKEAKGITLGTLEQFPDEKLKEPLAIKDLYNGVEAFAIRTNGGCVRLIGNTDLGVSHAVFRFLELAGCRWFFPGPTWEIVPENRNLSFNLNEVSRPDIWSRDIWFTRTAQSWEKGDPDGTAILKKWSEENRIGNSLKVKIYHKWQAIPIEYKQEFEGHPEYFALVDGTRTPPQFCVTNPGLQKVMIEYANQYFEKNPTDDMVTLDPADQAGWCTCPDCAKLGYHGNQAFFLANIVAKELQKTHPGKFVGLLAYSWHSDAPPFTLEPNVYVQLTAGMNASKFNFDDLFKAWTTKCSHIGIYEYFSYWEMDKCMLPGTGIEDNLDGMGARIKKYVDNHINSISGQSSSNWGVNGLGYYIAGKMMWNCSADVHALKKDFYDKAFGPASTVMERYYERLNLANNPLPGAGLLRQCLDDLEQAATLAKDRPDVEARLDALKENLVYNYIGEKVEDSNGDAEVKKNTLDWFTWSYRTRNNYMDDWIDFRSTVGRPAAEKMNEPTWFWRNTKDNPWRNDEPVSRQELEQKFQEIKNDLGDLPAISQAKFSSEYVLVDTGDKNDGGETKRTFTGSATILLASMNGEPLRFTIEKRDTGSLEAPDAVYSLVTLAGKDVVSGQFPTGPHEMELKVPGPGIYRFTCKRGGAGWDVSFPGELNNALVYQRGTTCRPSPVAPCYFYVPKNVSSIVLYLENGSFTMRDPGGKIVLNGGTNGKYISIPVPPGMTGKVWSLGGKLHNLLFFNLPTVLSSNPRWIFVPREIAKNDGLKTTLPK